MKNIISKIILKYLQTLTCFYVKRHRIDIFGLTGSVGKTTLTIALHEVLSKKYKVGMTFRAGHGLNSESGIPFALLDVPVDGYLAFDWLKYLAKATINFFTKKPKYEKFVIEMGVDKPGDMDFILSMTKADLGIFLSISKVHTENFEKLAKDDDNLLNLVFEEKAKIIKALDATGWAVLNYDIKMIRDLSKFTKAKIITFGLKEGADVRGKIVELTSDVFKGEIYFKSNRYDIQINNFFVNKRTFSTLLAAFTVGITYDIDSKMCINALENLELPPGRMSKIDGIKKILIIDSSYNSSKSSLLEALDNLDLYNDRKKIAVLGDMRELGKESESEHKSVAKRAVEVTDEIVTIGPAMKRYFYPEAVKLGFNRNKIHVFDNTWKALYFIRDKLIKGGEAILVKGSQNTLFLEIIVEGLLRNKEDKELLCRRGVFWEQKRQGLKHFN